MGKRRGKKGRGRRGSRAVPIVQTATILYPSLNAFRSAGLTEAGLRQAIYDTTGISINKAGGGPDHDFKKGIAMAVVLFAESTIGAKVASRVGINRLVKKATGGMLKVM